MDFARTLAAFFKPVHPPQEDKPGNALGHLGRYRLHKQIGQGAMGAVWAAEDPVLSRSVALKTVNVDLSPEERARFEDTFLYEARAAAKLNHPSIVTVYDAGKVKEGPYIAMELLEGEDLKTMMARGDLMSPSRASDIISRVADALEYAHSIGIVHRDIKPANIFLVGRKIPKVLDFGIAQFARSHTSMMADQKLLGSPGYMAPELIEGGRADNRSDIFSLGVVFYELLTGKAPFFGDQLQDLLNAICKAAPVPPHQVNPDVPLEVSMIVGKALAKKPEDRYQRAGDFAADLRRWATTTRVRKLLQQQTAENSATQEFVRKKRRSLWLGGSLAAVLVAATAIFWLLNVGLLGPGNEPAVVTGSTMPRPSAVTRAPKIVVPQVGVNVVAEAPPSEPAEDPARLLAAAQAAKETADKRKAEREKREQAKALALAAKAAPAEPALPVTGVVSLAVSPWGEVVVNGARKGLSPPLTQLSLPAGKHTIEIRNSDFEPLITTVEVEGDKTVRIRHKFGS